MYMLGYRVARVEQTETPEMLKERNDRKGGKKDKVRILFGIHVCMHSIFVRMHGM